MVIAARNLSDTAKELEEKIKLLQKMQKGEEDMGAVVEIKRLDGKTTVLLEKEDLKWYQRAKNNWYNLGDKNTKLFHTYAT